jgi:murein DD-endopeptidase / murein LD-carboxypeptidase
VNLNNCMRTVLIDLTCYVKRSADIPILLILIFSLSVASCSKQHYPISSASKKSVVFNTEMQSFLKGGAERKLDTGRKKPNQIIKTAEKFKGTPHCMGGTTRKCLDCSGLTYASFAAHKILLPRNSQEQARYGQIIYNRNDLKRGDLVFFTKSYKSSDYITHVGIYLGKNKFIHASSSKGVTETPLHNQWWSDRFVFGTRIF